MPAPRHSTCSFNISQAAVLNYCAKPDPTTLCNENKLNWTEIRSVSIHGCFGVASQGPDTRTAFQVMYSRLASKPHSRDHHRCSRIDERILVIGPHLDVLLYPGIETDPFVTHCRYRPSFPTRCCLDSNASLLYASRVLHNRLSNRHGVR